jgi:Domain of unknown function (DUF5615)
VLRILLDEGISRAVARDLQASGYAIEHALDLNLKGQPDPIIFHIAQQRLAAICTLNRADYLLLALAWTAWGLGPHSGLITPRPGRQPKPAAITQTLRALCDQTTTLQGQVIYL